MYFRQHTGRLVPPTKKRKRTLVLLISLLLTPVHIALTPLAARADTSRVIIQEIAWGGGSHSIADEWIELANLGNATTTIGGWLITGAGFGDKTISLPEDAKIPPFGTYLIANYAGDDEKTALATEIALTTSTLSISNSSLQIELRDAMDTIVDRAGDGNEPFAGSSASHTSMIRVDAENGDVATSWTSATTSVGFKEDADDVGTPGFCDLCVISEPEQVEEPPEEVTEEVVEETEEDATASSTDTGTSGETIDIETEEEIETASSTTGEVDAASETETEEMAEEADTTETEIISTSSTESEVSEQLNNSTNQQSESTENESSIPNQAQTVQTSTATTNADPITIFLNEAVSNPLSGPEWVELYAPDEAVTKTDRDLELWDASGKIMTIPKGTALAAPHYLLVALSSAKLNNGGDELSVRESSGIAIDQTQIPKTSQGESWAKDSTDGTWKIAEALTPAAPNIFPTVEISEETTETTQTSESSTESETAQQLNNSTIQQSSTNTETTETEELTNETSEKDKPDFTNQINDVFAAALASNTLASEQKTVTTASNKNTTTSDSLNLHDFNDMFDSSLNEARVRVEGTVGSVPKQLGASHNFILLSEDGRGLIVYVPKHLNIPPLGSTIQVGGTLQATYQGPELRMKKTDVWMTVATSTPPVPRFVDLLAPSAEDAWSLVVVEGAVTDIKSTSLKLETDDGIEVAILVPAAIGYRTSRLEKGDRVRITGVFDIRKDLPSISPRTPEEIELIAHAEDTVAAVSAEPKKHFPDWVPFAAAGGAIALTGVSKRARELIRKRKIKLLMKKAEASAG